KGGSKGSQQMLHFDTSSDKWIPIEGTNYKKEFDTWIAEHLGLTYETFTSSVLLLQGKAEKLLDSKPEGRREVLASIVDLERYERLHKESDDQRKAQEATLKTLSARLAALPAVQPLELVAAKNNIEDAELARREARAEVERLQKLEGLVQGWESLQKRLGHAAERLARAQNLLNEAATIEEKVNRLRELRE